MAEFWDKSKYCSCGMLLQHSSQQSEPWNKASHCSLNNANTHLKLVAESDARWFWYMVKLKREGNGLDGTEVKRLLSNCSTVRVDGNKTFSKEDN